MLMGYILNVQKIDRTITLFVYNLVILNLFKFLLSKNLLYKNNSGIHEGVLMQISEQDFIFY